MFRQSVTLCCVTTDTRKWNAMSAMSLLQLFKMIMLFHLYVGFAFNLFGFQNTKIIVTYVNLIIRYYYVLKSIVEPIGELHYY